MQAFYTLSGGGKKYRDRTVVFLGLWHTFKMANIVIFKAFSKSFMAPLFHHIIPGHQFYEPPSRLIQIQEWFCHLRLSYDPAMKAKMERCFATERMAGPHRKLLHSLQDLLTFYIPAVRSPCLLFVAALSCS